MTSPASATFVVELTPPGRGAVAVVLVEGPDAVRAVSYYFSARSGRALGQVPVGQIVFGHWGKPVGEELVVCRRAPDRVEVHCHGGEAAVAAVISRLLDQGCQRLAWRDWVSQSSTDSITAAAHIALAEATTERTAAIVLDQLNGALSSAIRELISLVTSTDWLTASTKIDELLSRRKQGLHLTKPWRIVVAGAPNVGKSSLMNAIAGYNRAIVSATPGTTRDVVSITTAIDGWPVHLSDTAGFRETTDELESAGIALATTALAHAELAIFVDDATTISRKSNDTAIHAIQSTLSADVPAIQVLNKIDLIPSAERARLLEQFVTSQRDNRQPYAISALHNEGVAELISAIGRILAPVPFPPSSPVPFTTEQVDELIAAKSAIELRDTAAASEVLHAMLTTN